jgi:hypothetical protein
MVFYHHSIKESDMQTPADLDRIRDRELNRHLDDKYGDTPTQPDPDDAADEERQASWDSQVEHLEVILAHDAITQGDGK